jgi:Ion channel
VASIPELLARIPDEFKPLAALGIGAFVLVFLALFHGVGLHWIQLQQRRGERRMRSGPPSVIGASFLFAWSVFLMLDLHLLEILIWSFVLTHMGLIVHAYDAIYFCANGYTTLGMGKMDVSEHWRIISPIIGISGLFTFAWTTSALVDVVASNRRLLEQMEDEREQEMHMRFALRKEEWEALKCDWAAMRAEREKLRIKTTGFSWFERLRILKEEKKGIEDLRKASRAVEALRNKERQDEKGIDNARNGDSPDKKQ